MMIKQSRWRWLGIIPWLLLIAWFLLPTMSIIDQIQRGAPLPPDLATYVQAAARLRTGAPLYAPPAEARQTWLTMHMLERANFLADVNAVAAANIPGPYVYLPALALWIFWLNLLPAICMALLFLAVIGFSTLWVYSARMQPPSAGRATLRSSWWLLFVIGSWPILSSLTAGNVEIMLLLAVLLAAWALWRSQAVLSAPLIAFVVLVKPYYALFFVAFGLLLLVNPDHNRRTVWGRLSTSAMVTLIVVVSAVVMWGPALRPAALQYVNHALDYSWFVLPVEQQTPLSMWNRTPLQGLVNLGIEPQRAQQLALALWAFALLGTLWLSRGRRLTFAITFALALVLLYWGRPVGWGFYFLEIVVLVAAWPVLRSWQRPLLLAAVLALIASHWLALLWTLQGVWLRLVTTQSAEWPWETWLVLPLAWLVLVTAAGRVQAPTSPSNVEEAGE